MMKTPRDHLETLTELGLNFCEAKVYLALVHAGISTAKSIAKVSSVSKPDVYRVLTTLLDKALIEKIISSPSMFRALALEDCLSILLKKKDEEHCRLKEKTEQLRLNFKRKESQQATQDSQEQFILISAKEKELERRRKDSKNAQKTIDIINSSKRFPKTAFFLADDTRQALERGVKVRLITQKPHNINDTFEYHSDVEKSRLYRIRYIDYPPQAIVSIYDESSVIVSTSSVANLGEASIFWTCNKPIVKVMQEYFKMLWARATQ